MVGKNKLILCPAEMCAAMEMYLNNKFGLVGVDVFNVEQNQDEFTIEFEVEGKSKDVPQRPHPMGGGNPLAGITHK